MGRQILTLALVMCMSAGLEPLASPDPRRAQSNRDGTATRLRFAGDPSCGKKPQNWCLVAQPMPWTDEERTQVTALFRQLEQTARVRPFLEEFVRSNYNTLTKTMTGFTFIDADRRMPPIESWGNPAWISHFPEKGLFLTERFLHSGSHRDPIGYFDVRLVLIVHELFHVVDALHGYSASASFKRARGATLGAVDLRACEAVRTRRRRDSLRGPFEKAWTMARVEMRKLGIRNGIGRHLPIDTVCIQSAEGPPEAFAEFAAFWLIDDSAPRYFPTAMANWLTATFPSAR